MQFTCPYCNRPTTITSPNKDTAYRQIDIDASKMLYGSHVGLRYLAYACPNSECKELSLVLALKKNEWNGGGWSDTATIKSWNLLPESLAKPQPEYIPRAIVDDYNEACRILHLSPKASATLSRRCLQGIVRDYWGISRSTLGQEIKELKGKVSSDVWEAIDSIRSVGNIGAHFEKDVNLVIDIEPDEAELLISLIEDLFIDWYVTRHDRQVRQGNLRDLARKKQTLRKAKERGEN